MFFAHGVKVLMLGLYLLYRFPERSVFLLIDRRVGLRSVIIRGDNLIAVGTSFTAALAFKSASSRGRYMGRSVKSGPLVHTRKCRRGW